MVLKQASHLSVAIVLAAPILVTAACSPERVPKTDVAVRDSAGIRVVENHVDGGAVPLYGQLGTIQVEVGVREGDPNYSLTQVRAVRTTSAGGMVVADPTTRELRFFDRAGLHLRTLGGQGEGPGEFSSLSTLAGIASDTVWAWDSRNQRMTTFSPEGVLLDAAVFQGDFYSRLSQVYRLSDGNWLGISSWRPRDIGGPRSQSLAITRDSLVLRLLRPNGEELDTIAVVPGGESISDVSVNGNRISERNFRRPFGRATYIALGPEGVVVGSNDRFEVLSFDPTGALRMLVRAQDLDVPINPEEVSRARALHLEEAREYPQFRKTVEATYSDFPLPEIRPAFSAIRVASGGDVWLAEYAVDPDSVSTWLVLDSHGELLGRVEVPPGLQIHEVGQDYVIGVWHDEFEVPFVRRYSFLRGN